ncbi:MAG: hypothetical protein A2156_05115 [Deltaproteobacteria bacterium RBG_16_48_10]|nr:MAG: hypothetical protein A2156_05115 [Deltaproteobacteria bacterium RBG_16_48_10]
MKSRGKRLYIPLVLVIFGMLVVNAAVAKEDYPNKPIKAIVAFSAGGGNDQCMRLIQPYLAKELGVPVVVENRDGGGGEIATTLLYREPADGYTILSNNDEYIAVSTVLRTPAYKYEDIVPVVMELIEPRILLVKKSSPFNTLTDIIEASKKNPGKLAFGGATSGNQQLLLLILRERLKLDYRFVGYPGGAPSRAAMLGGHIDGAIGETAGAYYLRDQTKAVCLFYDKPSPLWPEAKPVNEQLTRYGVKLPELALYRIYYARRELKEKYPERYSKLQNAFIKASKDPEYQEKAEKMGFARVQVWAPAEKYKDVLSEQIEVFRETKDLWKVK